jgi:phosphoglycerate dehydrogenase-like enzyme
VATRVVLIAPNLAGYAGWLVEQVAAPIAVEVAPTFRDEDVCPLLDEAEIAVTSHWTVAMGRAARRLRFIQLPGAGWDKIAAAAVPEGVLVANCYEHERAIAEYVALACLALSRRLLEADRTIRQGNWRLFPAVSDVQYAELGGRTIGIVGLGRIGRAVAAMAGAFGMRRIGVDVRPPPAAVRRGFAWVGGPAELDRLLGEADFAVLAVPHTAETRGLLGARELGLLKPTAFLVNPARAELVDQGALYEALRAGRFAGAALDVWWHYPQGDEVVAPADLPFADLPNVLMTPHLSGSTSGTFERRMRVVAANLSRFLRGEPVAHVVGELSRRRA